MKLMKAALKYGTVFGAGVLCTAFAAAFAAVYASENPDPDGELLILNGDGDKQYKVVVIGDHVPNDGSLSLAAITRIK